MILGTTLSFCRTRLRRVIEPRMRSAHGGPSRWTMSGTGLHDLTLSPSVDVGSKNSKCWHGWIKEGNVT
jgi:hypothetical protein